jgi:hypothetical protein
MKKRNLKRESKEEIITDENQPQEEQHPGSVTDDFSINAFIKIKKLQNQILEKMLENMNQPLPTNKDQKRKNK